MKYIYNQIAFISLAMMLGSCTDDPLIESSSSAPDFNIEKFSDGYSIAFDVTLDELGGGMNTRADINDLELSLWENMLKPEEFRILFFDQNDNFLFESKTRYFAEQEAKNGKITYRVGVPVFQYVSDGYNDTGSNEGIPLNEEYNWERIVDLMKTNRFKIAILANRPEKAEVPELSDWPAGDTSNNIYTDKNSDEYKFWMALKSDFAENGPFWTPVNSIATDADKRETVATVLDLHHCQFDPLYFGKSYGNNGYKNGNGWYDFILDFNHKKTIEWDGGSKTDNIPFMGAISSWISLKRTRTVGTRTLRYYRLPLDRVVSKDHEANEVDALDDPQYIPMYGIQEFDPIPEWTKGTTFNVSQQTASQVGYYGYKNIFLLRSVVKLELRIPMYNKSGQYVDVDNKWAQLLLNNYMARCEPMDVSTPTDQIWKDNHGSDCEWTRIRDHGLFCTTDVSGAGAFKKKLGWYYGVWKEQGWKFEGYGITLNDIVLKPKENPDANPRIFNPITQRLQTSLITDCYLPIEVFNSDGSRNKTQSYHRWVIYCGERNMNDFNKLGDGTSYGYIACFRMKATINNTSYTYYLPILDYNHYDTKINNKENPLKSYLKMTSATAINEVASVPNEWNNYCNDIRDNCKDIAYKNFYPFPLLRNHFYRLTVAFGDNDDINVHLINSEQRNVTGIQFN